MSVITYEYEAENILERRILSAPHQENEKVQEIQTLENDRGDWVEKRMYEDGQLISVHKRELTYSN